MAQIHGRTLPAALFVWAGLAFSTGGTALVQPLIDASATPSSSPSFTPSLTPSRLADPPTSTPTASPTSTPTSTPSVSTSPTDPATSTAWPRSLHLPRHPRRHPPLSRRPRLSLRPRHRPLKPSLLPPSASTRSPGPARPPAPSMSGSNWPTWGTIRSISVVGG